MPEMIEVAAQQPVKAYLTRPDGEAKGAVIVIHEVWGLNDHVKSVADRYAAEGYVALAPDLLSDTIDTEAIAGLQVELFNPEKRNEVQPELRKHMTPMQNPEFGAETTERLKACFDYLYELPEARQKVAINGFCFGGTYSFNLAVVEPRLKIALPFYGHSDHSVEELKKISCPVYLFLGERDERLVAGLPGLTERMQEAGVDFHSKVYPDCGHAFFNDTNPYAYDEAAAQDAWRRVLQLLGEHVAKQ